MLKNKTRLLLACLCMVTGVMQLLQNAHAAEAESQPDFDSIPDTPGTGAFPAIKEVDPGLPNQVVYRPANLKALGSTKLGVYAFGNGSCTDDAAHTRLHLLEVASHGYLAIVPGGIYSGPEATQRPTPQVQDPNAAPTQPEQLAQAIDWALKENLRVGSPYYGLIDPSAVAVSGFSCGGLQALFNIGNPRVATVVMMNSGLFVDGPTNMAGMVGEKKMLQNLHTPIIYILGGPSDIAYDEGMDDYASINHVPAAVANIERGHGGTYWDPDGGAAAKVVVNWLNWQLRGDEKASQMFVGNDCGLCKDSEWSYLRKNIE